MDQDRSPPTEKHETPVRGNSRIHCCGTCHFTLKRTGRNWSWIDPEGRYSWQQANPAQPYPGLLQALKIEPLTALSSPQKADIPGKPVQLYSGLLYALKRKPLTVVASSQKTDIPGNTRTLHSCVMACLGFKEKTLDSCGFFTEDRYSWQYANPAQLCHGLLRL